MVIRIISTNHEIVMELRIMVIRIISTNYVIVMELRIISMVLQITIKCLMHTVLNKEHLRLITVGLELIRHRAYRLYNHVIRASVGRPLTVHTLIELTFYN